MLEQYPAGSLLEEEWEQIMIEECQHDYTSQAPGVGVTYEVTDGIVHEGFDTAHSNEEGRQIIDCSYIALQ